MLAFSIALMILLSAIYTICSFTSVSKLHLEAPYRVQYNYPLYDPHYGGEGYHGGYGGPRVGGYPPNNSGIKLIVILIFGAGYLVHDKISTLLDSFDGQIPKPIFDEPIDSILLQNETLESDLIVDPHLEPKEALNAPQIVESPTNYEETDCVWLRDYQLRENAEKLKKQYPKWNIEIEESTSGVFFAYRRAKNKADANALYIEMMQSDYAKDFSRFDIELQVRTIQQQII